MAAIVVGSIASSVDDEMSDVDLLVLVRDFATAWADRGLLEGPDAVVAWDATVQSGVGAHKWLTGDGVLVECLLGEVGSFRLAEPYRLLAGDGRALDQVPRRPAPSREELRRGEIHPIERAYDELKAAVRAERDAR